MAQQARQHPEVAEAGEAELWRDLQEVQQAAFEAVMKPSRWCWRGPRGRSSAEQRLGRAGLWEAMTQRQKHFQLWVAALQLWQVDRTRGLELLESVAEVEEWRDDPRHEVFIAGQRGGEERHGAREQA